MKSRKTRTNVLSTILWISSFLSMISFPVWAVSIKYPLWREQGHGGIAIGSGTIIITVIVFVCFKKYISAFAAEKLGLIISSGVSLVLLWSGLALSCAILAKATTVLDDLTTVFVWSAVGTLLGVVMQIIAKFAAEYTSDKEERYDEIE